MPSPPFLRRALPRGAAAAAAALAFLAAAPAAAYCPGTTCSADCPRDDDGCKTTGKRLFWPSRCVGFSVQKDGTANLPMEEVRPVIEDAFLAWTDLPCAAGTASIAFSPLADVSCHTAEYDPDGPNANVVLFQDSKWEYTGVDNNLAKTTVTYDPDSGEILDADIELNFAFNELTVGDDAVVYDLASILTHEVGHFIGLDHSPAPEATMFAGYEEGSIEQRTLELDDVEGACATYPPEREATCSPEPKNGLGDACAGDDEGDGGGGGCSAAGGAGAGQAGAWLVCAAARDIGAIEMRRHATWFFLAAALTALSPSCDGGGGTADEKLCDPGTEVFCRPCSGFPDEKGTKTCNADGTGFGECVPRGGACPVIACTPGELLFCTCEVAGAQKAGERLCNDDGTGYTPCDCTGTGNGGAGGGAGGAGGGGGEGTSPLYAPCVLDSECASKSCPMGYCTQPCSKISDCAFGVAECVQLDGTAICMPTCKDQSYCDVYGPPSQCGYTPAIDDFPVTTCADWLGDLTLPPDGTDCTSDVECNLGHLGQERVCAFEACTTGCYEDVDCPRALTCSSTGALGSCE